MSLELLKFWYVLKTISLQERRWINTRIILGFCYQIQQTLLWSLSTAQKKGNWCLPQEYHMNIEVRQKEDKDNQTTRHQTMPHVKLADVRLIFISSWCQMSLSHKNEVVETRSRHVSETCFKYKSITVPVGPVSFSEFFLLSRPFPKKSDGKIQRISPLEAQVEWQQNFNWTRIANCIIAYFFYRCILCAQCPYAHPIGWQH